MQIRFHCPTDGCVAIIEYEPLEQCGPAIRCPRCGIEHPMKITQSMRENNMVDRCSICGCNELFIRKDFPQKLGVAVVVVFGLLAIWCFTFSLFAALGVLTVAVAIDLVAYALTGRCTTCFACRAEYRKCAFNPAHEDFDLATSEKY